MNREKVVVLVSIGGQVSNNIIREVKKNKMEINAELKKQFKAMEAGAINHAYKKVAENDWEFDIEKWNSFQY